MAAVKNNMRKIVLLFLALAFLFSSCDHGQLGGADQTITYFPGDSVFHERLNFLSGVWYSRYPGIGRLDGYRVRKWDDVTDEDRAKMRAIFPRMNLDSPRTYSSRTVPQSGDYVLLYDDTVYGQQDDGAGGNESWGFSYAGLVRAINIFNNDLSRGAIIIEYFEETDPKWLWSADSYFGVSQGLRQGEKPFFGIYYRVIDSNTVQMANAVDLAAMYEGNLYYTEKRTLQEAIETNTVENEAEFISWGVVTPKNREGQ